MLKKLFYLGSRLGLRFRANGLRVCAVGSGPQPYKRQALNNVTVFEKVQGLGFRVHGWLSKLWSLLGP